MMSSAMELYSRGGTPILKPPSYAQNRPVRVCSGVRAGFGPSSAVSSPAVPLQSRNHHSIPALYIAPAGQFPPSVSNFASVLPWHTVLTMRVMRATLYI